MRIDKTKKSIYENDPKDTTFDGSIIDDTQIIEDKTNEEDENKHSKGIFNMFTSAFIGSKSHKKETKETVKQESGKIFSEQIIGPVFTDYEKKNETMINKE